MKKHWTEDSIQDFVYRIGFDFVAQLERRMETEVISRTTLAQRLGVTTGRVSQILNSPGNLTLKNVVRFARILGIKVSVVAYDDGDPDNHNGPVNSEIFQISWKRAGSPSDLFAFTNTLPIVRTRTLLFVTDPNGAADSNDLHEIMSGLEPLNEDPTSETTPRWSKGLLVQEGGHGRSQTAQL